MRRRGPIYGHPWDHSVVCSGAEPAPPGQTVTSSVAQRRHPQLELLLQLLRRVAAPGFPAGLEALSPLRPTPALTVFLFTPPPFFTTVRLEPALAGSEPNRPGQVHRQLKWAALFRGVLRREDLKSTPARFSVLCSWCVCACGGVGPPTTPAPLCRRLPPPSACACQTMAWSAVGRGRTGPQKTMLWPDRPI